MDAINAKYEELIDWIAENIKNAIEDEQKAGQKPDTSDIIMQEIDNGVMYYEDQATIIAYATAHGFVQWGDADAWDKAFVMLHEDVTKKAEEL